MGATPLRLPAVFRRPAWGLLLVMFAVAGCSAKMPWQDTQALPCPDYRIPAEAANLVKFRDGPGRDLTDVEYHGRIANVQLACLHDINQDTHTGKLTVDVTPVMLVERGPANTTREATFPYFIAVTDTKKNILFRQRLTQKVAFPGNRTRQVINVEPSTLEIPLAKNQQGHDFIIYFGFDLTHDQLDFNRKQLQDQR